MVKNIPSSYFQFQETGFYYLQSRYYDPNLCRFINADVFASTGQGFIGTNMFAYCLNNPVNCVDASGNLPLRTYSVVITDTGNACDAYYSSYLEREYQKNNSGTMMAKAVKYNDVGTGPDISCAVIGVSLSHTELPNETGSVVLHNDVLAAEFGGSVGVRGLKMEASAILVSTGVSFALFDDVSLTLSTNLRVGASLGVSSENIGFSFSCGLGFSVFLS